jgi:predicted dithiol-disulfide oxidoreductase (DUF899 family)
MVNKFKEWMMTQNNSDLPKIVSREAWQQARQAFLVKEKEMTRRQDELNAERRRLPMVKIDKSYTFSGPEGEVSLLDLFEGRRQLILYHFMFGPDWDEGCSGCSMFVDNLGHPAHLNARDTSRVLVSRAPLAKLEAYKQRLGWDMPWYSSYGSDFNYDFGVTNGDDETFGLSVFLRDGDDIYQTYFNNGRGVEAYGSNWTFLDLTPLGRQETWEKVPNGGPQTPPYEWWRRHDQYQD